MHGLATANRFAKGVQVRIQNIHVLDDGNLTPEHECPGYGPVRHWRNRVFAVAKTKEYYISDV